jgi:alpha-galactosidase
MHDALNATGRPILFSICDWQDSAAYWAPPLGNSWRTTDDINTGWSSVMRNLIENNAYWEVAAPGQWNDPDMLEVGNGLTHDEGVSHFSLWCLVKSPLILGNDLRNMTQDTLQILTNDEVIAINQDALGIQGRLVSSTTLFDVWAGPLEDGSVAVVLFNRNDTHVADTIVARWEDIGLPAGAKATVRDLWLHEDVGTFSGQYTVKGLKPRQSVTIRVTPNNGGVREQVVRKAIRARDAARRAKYQGW